MDRLSHHVNTLIAFLARERPATAFAIAHLFKEKLGPAARDAAYLSLRRTSAQITQEQAALAHDDTELQHAFNRLIRYRQSCTSCARSTADNVNRISCYDVPGSMEKDWCSCPAYSTGYKPGRGIERYPMWVRDFMEGCKEVLEETPHPDMMLDARLYILPVKTAAGSGCARCRVTVDGLPLFGARLAKKVALALEGTFVSAAAHNIASDFCLRCTLVIPLNMYSDAQVLNWTLSSDDLGACPHADCKDICFGFWPLQDPTNIGLAMNPATLPMAKCMFCPHVAIFHKKKAAPNRPSASDFAPQANTAPQFPKTAGPTPTQSTLFGSRPPVYTPPAYSSTASTSTAPASSAFGFDPNVFKTHTSVRTDRVDQAQDAAPHPAPTNPRPTSIPSYAARAAGRSEDIGNNTMAQKEGKPQSKLQNHFHPSTDNATEASTNGRKRPKGSRKSKKSLGGQDVSGAKSLSSKAGDTVEFTIALLPNTAAVHGGYCRLPKADGLVRLDSLELVKTVKIFSDDSAENISEKITTLFRHVPELCESADACDEAHSTHPNDPNLPFAAWVPLFPRKIKRGVAPLLKPYPQTRQLDLSQLRRLAAASAVRNAKTAFKNLVLIALPQGRGDIADALGSDDDSEDETDDDDDDDDEDGDEEECEEEDASVLPSDTGGVEDPVGEGSNKGEESNGDLTDIMPPPKRPRTDKGPSTSDTATESPSMSANSNTPASASGPSTTVLAWQQSWALYLLGNVVEPRPRNSSMWPSIPHAMYGPALASMKAMKAAHSVYYGKTTASTSLDELIFWNSFIVPFIDSIDFLKTLAAELPTFSSDEVTAATTKFGPHGLHEIAEGLSYVYTFLPTVTFPSHDVWKQYRTTLGEISKSIYGLVRNFYRCPTSPSPDVYSIPAIRLFARAVAQCDKKRELQIASEYDWRKLHVVFLLDS
ncbi:uncharacterized protein STEHIDRAFT_164077, partial [Stereum hirsutum FP-91666 SS1]